MKKTIIDKIGKEYLASYRNAYSPMPRIKGNYLDNKLKKKTLKELGKRRMVFYGQ